MNTKFNPVIGMIVEIDGRRGVIEDVSEVCFKRIMVRFDDDQSQRYTRHPTYKINYYIDDKIIWSFK